MDQTVENIEITMVDTAKDLVMQYIENPAQRYLLGFAKDIEKYVFSVRLVEGMYGYAGLSYVEKGQVTKQFFENNDSDLEEWFDIYSLYVVESNEVQFISVGSIVDYENDDEFGERYVVNFEEKTLESETISSKEVQKLVAPLGLLVHPKNEGEVIKLHVHEPKQQDTVQESYVEIEFNPVFTPPSF